MQVEADGKIIIEVKSFGAEVKTGNSEVIIKKFALGPGWTIENKDFTGKMRALDRPWRVTFETQHMAAGWKFKHFRAVGFNGLPLPMGVGNRTALTRELYWNSMQTSELLVSGLKPTPREGCDHAVATSLLHG